MSIKNIWFSSLFQTLSEAKLILWLWLANLFFALAVIFPFRGILSRTFADRTSLEHVFMSFDGELIMEFLRHQSSSIDVVLSQSIWVLLFYFIFSIFILGGILTAIKNHHFDLKNRGFWLGAGHYFWPLLGLAVIFGLLLFLVLFMIFKLYTSSGLNPFLLEEDLDFVRPIYYLIPLGFIFYFGIKMIHDFSKIHLVNSDKLSISYAIKRAIRSVFKNWPTAIVLLGINLFLMLMVGVLYHCLVAHLPMESYILVFLISQAYLIIRIASKILNLYCFWYIVEYEQGG